MIIRDKMCPSSQVSDSNMNNNNNNNNNNKRHISQSKQVINLRWTLALWTGPMIIVLMAMLLVGHSHMIELLSYETIQSITSRLSQEKNCLLENCLEQRVDNNNYENNAKLLSSARAATGAGASGALAIQDMQASEHPVIFVPGDGGSQLEARLNKTYRVRYICTQKSDWYDIWLNIHLLAPLVIDCFYDNIRLHLNPKTGLTSNTPGVEIRARDFGSLEPVSYLDSLRMPKTDYFETIIRELESTNSLVRNVDMFGASFDFRRAPNELSTWFSNLSSLIELKSKSQPVSLVCHSMGCLNAVLLLNQKTQSWKQLHVARLIAIAAPWSGSFKALSAMLFGDSLGIPLLDASKLRQLQASWPSLMYLFPRQPAFDASQVLINTPSINYTLNNLDSMFDVANMTNQRQIWHQTRQIANSLRAPNVELWCIYGTGVATPSSLKLELDLGEAINTWNFQELMGDGDGTVNVASSELCQQWAKQQEKPVYLRNIPGLDHMRILRDPGVARTISSEILIQNFS